MASASQPVNRDFSLLELDPFQEIVGIVIRRKKDRRQQEYPASQITFLQTLFVFIDCIIPACRGHQKFGIIESDNIPVIFKCHDFNDEAKYVAYKTPICRPLRVPLTGDFLLNGLKWHMVNAASMATVSQTLFDCLIASLKLQTLTFEFCLECLFRHCNGAGLGLERFLKTVLYHIVVLGRFVEREGFQSILKYQKGMDFKFRRVHWERRNEMFKLCGVVTKKSGIRNETYFSLPGEITQEYPNIPQHGVYGNPSLMFLTNLGSVSVIHVSVQCHCHNKRLIPKLAHIGIIRQSKNCDFINVALARWVQDGDEYSDPLLNWSLFGPDIPNRAVYTKINVDPLASVCNRCKTQVLVKNVFVPSTTWLFMAEVPISLQKSSVEVFAPVSSFALGDAVFELKFILLYNTTTGSFTSMNYIDQQWYFLDDRAGGIMKRCNPDRVKYKERVNLRAFYFRKTETNPHQCLKDAVDRL